MAQAQQALLGEGGHARLEGAEPQGVDVDPAADGGVGGVEQLEAAVDLEAVDALGADPAADLVGGLEHEHVVPRTDQLDGAAQAGQPGPDDDDVGLGVPPVHAAAQPRGAAST